MLKIRRDPFSLFLMLGFYQKFALWQRWPPPFFSFASWRLCVKFLLVDMLNALIPRRRLHRSVFILAGVYNLLWGFFTVIKPQWLFHFANMELSNYPQIFACLGMVVGLYGILYLEVARLPERGWLLAAVGLLGKLLGPIGLLPLVVSGQWPARTVVLCLTNDLIWWIPFALYLRDSWRFFFTVKA